MALKTKLMNLLALFVASCSWGCASILGASPTFEYCQSIEYTRKGNLIEVHASCSAPIGGGSLPVPKLP